MPEEEKAAQEAARIAAEGATPPTAEAFEELSKQVGNLNKGIATYRDEANTAKEVAKVANEKVAEFEKANKKKEDDDAKANLSPDDQKKFDAWAKTQGFATKEELNAEKSKIAQESAKTTATTAVNEFLETHPEYDDDETWQKVQAEFNQYKQPADLASYKKLLEKIHNDLSGGDSGKARARVKAELANKKRLSLGGKGGGATGEEGEARIDELQSKYPNLSRDQIEGRISEIDGIYESRKKEKEE